MSISKKKINLLADKSVQLIWDAKIAERTALETLDSDHVATMIELKAKHEGIREAARLLGIDDELDQLIIEKLKA